MRLTSRMAISTFLLGNALVLSAVHAGTALADCKALPNQSALQTALRNAVDGNNAGLNNEMWATVVNRDGIVCLITFSGDLGAINGPAAG